jgi:integrase
MSVYKEMRTGTWTGKWIAYCYYTDWQGNRKPKMKRGFTSKKDGLEWEREFLQKLTKDINMSFAAFIEIYLKDKKSRLKYNTYLTKKHIIGKKILPYFGKLKLSSIKASDVIQWQNDLLDYRNENGVAYSDTYMRTVQNQLSAIFNHAIKYYDLPKNPSTIAGKMGKSKSKEMLFWTKEEYIKFSEAIKDKPISFYAFEILFWCGCRVGELLALTPSDVNFETKKITINKSFQRLEKEDYITDPKTEKSNRIIQMPDFLCEELKDFFDMLYGYLPKDRIFQVTKSYLHHEMQRGCKANGMKKIRIHDLRHSHVALLIEMGFSPVAISERLGHESIVITLQYAHLYPSKQIELADKLNIEHNIDPEV